MGTIIDSEIEVKCPECGYVQAVTLEDMINEEQIICGGCKKTIKLKLEGDDPAKVERELEKHFSSFSKEIKIKI